MLNKFVTTQLSAERVETKTKWRWDMTGCVLCHECAWEASILKWEHAIAINGWTFFAATIRAFVHIIHTPIWQEHIVLWPSAGMDDTESGVAIICPSILPGMHHYFLRFVSKCSNCVTADNMFLTGFFSFCTVVLGSAVLKLRGCRAPGWNWIVGRELLVCRHPCGSLRTFSTAAHTIIWHCYGILLCCALHATTRTDASDSE